MNGGKSANISPASLGFSVISRLPPRILVGHWKAGRIGVLGRLDLCKTTVGNKEKWASERGKRQTWHTSGENNRTCQTAEIRRNESYLDPFCRGIRRPAIIPINCPSRQRLEFVDVVALRENGDFHSSGYPRISKNRRPKPFSATNVLLVSCAPTADDTA